MTLAADALEVALGRRVVLRGVSLAVEPGELVAVVGPNGAGKSTLLRGLSGELTPRAGEVTLDQRALRAYPRDALARRRAVLPQRAQLSAGFHVDEVVALGRHPHRARQVEDARAVERALARVGLAELRGSLFTRLSGGEQQRVMLARVLAQLDGDAAASRFLLLDEPTAALDLAWQHHALELARALTREGVGVLAILHDLALAAMYADRVALLVEGQLVKTGAPAEVLSASNLQRAYGVRTRWIDIPDVGALPVVLGITPRSSPSTSPSTTTKRTEHP